MICSKWQESKTRNCSKLYWTCSKWCKTRPMPRSKWYGTKTMVCSKWYGTKTMTCSKLYKTNSVTYCICYLSKTMTYSKWYGSKKRRWKGSNLNDRGGITMIDMFVRFNQNNYMSYIFSNVSKTMSCSKCHGTRTRTCSSRWVSLIEWSCLSRSLEGSAHRRAAEMRPRREASRKSWMSFWTTEMGSATSLREPRGARGRWSISRQWCATLIR